MKHYRHGRFLIALLVFGVTAVGCGDGGGERSGREWINDGKTVETLLQPDGKLSIDKRFHPIVQSRYTGFIQMVAGILSKQQLFNRTPTPFRIYLMFDSTDYQKYAAVGLDGLGEFVPSERAIYMHADGKPLVDRGQNRRLVRELAYAVIHDMCEETYPKWFAVGLARYLSDGSFDGKKWFRGVPDHDAWREILKRRSEGIELLTNASDSEFDALGEFGIAFAQAVIYLLSELDQAKFNAIVYQTQVREVTDNSGFVKLLEEFVPNHEKRLARPIETLFALRPDLLSYLECGCAEPDLEILAKSRLNAETFGGNGGYWYQCAGLELKIRGDKAKAIALLEKSRACDPHRFLPECLDVLANLYNEAGDHVAMRAAVLQRMKISVMLTPRLHRLMAEAWRKDNKAAALRHVVEGLDLPAGGFESDVEALRKLQKSLQD